MPLSRLTTSCPLCLCGGKLHHEDTKGTKVEAGPTFEIPGRGNRNIFSGTVGHGTKVRRMGQNSPFSTHGGTAGQEGLSSTGTTIKCPTEVSHFRDARDTLGR